MVLPLTARNSSGSRSHDEKLQVLRSYTSVGLVPLSLVLSLSTKRSQISADHAALTRNLVGNAMKFNNSLNAFNTEFARFASRRVTSGQRELRDLSQKLADLENNIQQYVLYFTQICPKLMEMIDYVLQYVEFLLVYRLQPKRNFLQNSKITGPDVTHFAFSVFRMTASSKRKSSRARNSHQRLVSSSTIYSTSQHGNYIIGPQ